MNELLQQSSSMYNSLPYLWQKIAIAFLIGLLVGLERERKKKVGNRFFAGIRTYPMISIFGFSSALISTITDFSAFIGLFTVFGLLITVSYYFSAQKGELGGTSEISMIITFLAGALVFWGYVLLASTITIIVVSLLTFKSFFRGIAGKIDEEDIYATIKFAIITLIILPLLPDNYYGPYEVFNPRKIWYMVVLISSISFIGYVLFKLIGAKKGIQFLSFLGGIASSTAVTLSFTERSKENEKISDNLAAGVLLASSIMFPRVLVIIWVLVPELAYSLLVPFAIFTLVGLIISAVQWRNVNGEQYENIELSNPFRVLVAIKFGAIFAVILVLTKVGQFYFGDKGIYLTSVLSGFADLDAIALSIANLVKTSISIKVATIAIIIASLTNTITKMFIAVIWGSEIMRKKILLGFVPFIIVIVLTTLGLYVV